jgi:hypothetical protein
MADRNVSIRLATDGSAQVKADFASIAESGDASAKRLVASYSKASDDVQAAIDRQTRAAQRVQALIPSPVQASVNQSVGTGYDGSQNATAAEFTVLLAQQARQVEALRAAIDPLYTAQKRYDAELDTSTSLLKTGAISEAEYAKAVDLSAAALQRAQRAAAEQASPARITGSEPDAHVAAFAAAQAQQARQVEALRAAIDPLYTAQKRYDDEITVSSNLLKRGAISEAEYDAAVANSEATLARARRGLEESNGLLALNSTQMLIAEGAVHRFADSLLAGMSPGRSFMMQAGDIGNILAMDDGGVAGGLAKVRGLITPVTVGIGALAVVLGVGAAAWYSYDAAVDKLAQISQGAGAVLGENADQLEANAEAAAKAGNIRISSARDIEAGYLQVAKSGDVLVGLTAITQDFAAATGQDAKAAQQQLAAAFGDTVAGAEEMASKYGALNQAQVEHIAKLAEEGDQLGAQRELLNDLNRAFDGAASHATGLALAWDNIKSAADRAFNSAGAFFSKYGQGGLSAADAALGGSGYDFDWLFQKKATPAAPGNGNAAVNKQVQDVLKSVGIGAGGQDTEQSKLTASLSQINAVLGNTAERAALTASQLAQLKEKQDEYTHAVQSYLPAGQKQVELAQLDAQIAGSKGNPAKIAELNAQKARIENSGKLITAAQSEAEAEAKGTKARIDAANSGSKHAETLAREADAMRANAAAALQAGAAYLQSSAAGADAEARQKAAADATKAGISVDEQYARQQALNVANAIKDGDKQTAQMRDETKARQDVLAAVSSGALGVAAMNDALSDETKLRPLLIAQTNAQADQVEAATAAVKAMTAALRENHTAQEEVAAVQATFANDNTIGGLRDQASLAGDQSSAARIELARRAAERDAAQRYPDLAPDNPKRTGLVNSAVDVARQQQATDQAKLFGDAANSQRDQSEQLQAQIGLIGKSAAQQDLVLDKLKTEQQLRAAGVNLASDQAKTDLAGVAAVDQLKAHVQQQTAAWAEVQQFGDNFIDTVLNPSNWSSFGDMAKKVLGDIEEELIKLAAINPLKNMLFGESNPTIGSIGGVFSKLFGGGVNVDSLSSPAPGLTDLSSLAVSPVDVRGSIAHFAAGTDYAPGGVAEVGENGPEVLNLPRGSTVTNAADTRRMLGAANDTSKVVVQVQANDYFDAKVSSISGSQLQASAPRIAASGAQLAQSNQKRAARRRLGSR